MTQTRQFLARFVVAPAIVVALALLTTSCGSSEPKATATPTTPTTSAATTTAAATDSAYCKTARKWTVHEFNGEGDTFASDPVAFKKYWNEYMDFVATATRQSPAEIRHDWRVSYDVVKQFTPVLQKYDFDIERLKTEGSAADIAIGKRMDKGPNPAEQRAQDAVHEYEGKLCQTSQPPAADVSFAGTKPNKGYCEAARAADQLFGEVATHRFSIDAMRTFVTSDDFAALGDKAKQSAPAEIKADVVAVVDWQRNQGAAVIKKFGYDARKLMLEGSAADRAIFQQSDPAVAGHYARVVAYEEQLCGL